MASKPEPEGAEAPTPPHRVSRRSFLVGAAGAGAAFVVGGVSGAVMTRATEAPPIPAKPAGDQRAIIPFDGDHQAGIVRPVIPPAASIVAAFDVVGGNRGALVATLRELTNRARLLASGWSPEIGNPLFPPPESGIVGASTGPASLTVTVSAGASLFDDRFGLAPSRPRQLERMPKSPNDVLDPQQRDGDLLLQVAASDDHAALHGLRYLHAGTRDALRLRWLLEGFTRPDPVPTANHTSSRNLLGFKDGTANPPSDDATLMNELVWIQPGDDEPAWTVGGTYTVVRIIRMFVERWDRTALGEQEAIIGREKRTGAPLGMDREEEIPDYVHGPAGTAVPLDGHIRLANPRLPATERNRILRRPYSFSRGFDKAGLLDQGLLFVCHQRSLADGFIAVQERLNGEPLEEYIRPVGGGFFFTFPGTPGPDQFLGSSLLGGA